MTVAPLVAEVVIVGLEAVAWLALLTFTITGTSWIDLDSLQDWSVVLTILLLAVAYATGVLVDRVADSLFKRCLKWLRRQTHSVRLRKWSGEEPAAGHKRRRMAILHQSPGMTPFLEYQRSRERVARATALNLTFAAFMGGVFLADETSATGGAIAGYVAVGLSLALMSFWAAVRIAAAQEHRLADAFQVIAGMDYEAERARLNVGARPKAAAVCWKRFDGEVRFLLVQTKGGNWTFPKGKIDDEETAPEAAEREAKEESGAKGAIDDRVLAEYVPFPEDEGAPVKAYLMKVEKEGKPRKKERKIRKPAWFSAERAIEVLSDGREQRHADEHREVITAALERLACEAERT